MAADPAATAAAALEIVERTSALFVSAGENATTEVEKAAKRDTRAVNTFIVVAFPEDTEEMKCQNSETAEN